ncbi:MAG: Coenzyme F420 hydrogenase/dehydrogenase, beta subunit C-terminal domain [Oscillospiraceae bacterium]
MDNQIIEAWAVKHKEIDIRMNSRSGGIFTALTDCVLENGGVVYGAVLSEDCRSVSHARATTQEERNKFRGSKYIQSSVGDCYGLAKDDLDKGLSVVFSGTPCQIGGLYGFLGRDYENLLTIEVVCHGAASPLVWEHYVDWIEEKEKDTVVSADFRDKRKYGWGHHMESFVMKNKTVSTKWYANLFYSHNSIRPSCFKCPYRNLKRISDITIADCWGIAKNRPDFNDNKGVSLVLLNNDKGKSAFDAVTDSLIMIPVDINDYMQPALSRTDPVPETRDKFWVDFCSKKMSFLLREYANFTIKERIKKFYADKKEKYNKKWQSQE